MSLVQRVIQYFKDVKNELGKVNWPSRSQTFRYTMAVILISLGVAAFLGFCDYVFTNFLIRWI